MNCERENFDETQRETSRAMDCFDTIVAFPLVVEHMRAAANEDELTEGMLAGMRVAFRILDEEGDDGLIMYAAAAQDLLCRYFSQLTILNRYTRAYCTRVMKQFFAELTARRLRTFFILDNMLRDDRLAPHLELFPLCGVEAITPRLHGTEWADLSPKISRIIESGRHVIYIEPDALVNHLDAAKNLATQIPCVATFRNRGPDNPAFEVVNLLPF